MDGAQASPLLEYEPGAARRVDDYEPFVGGGMVERLKRLAEPVAGKGWANVNSTLIGGGVAEMLRSLLPLARGLGVRARWYVIQGSPQFFTVTKKFHNLLQGLDQPLSLEEIFGAYLDTINRNSKNALIASDLVVIHDPQPAALVMNEVIFGNVLWRCHIDTSAPNPVVWRFLLPYINHCAGAIFTMPQFVGPGLQVPLFQVMPCIDPLAQKNHWYSDQEALGVLGDLFDEHNVDPQRPILAAISRYDPHKNQGTVLEAFRLLRQRKRFDPPPYLILLGNTASDDPEGGATLQALRQQAGDDPDVRFWVNVDNNDRVVGALMHLARALVHVSTREGFGLVVSEALWQGTPVIGSRVGGITEQVLDGRTGFLVQPLSVESIAERMERVLTSPGLAAELGSAGREHVRRHFLLPELMRRYLVLLRFYTGLDAELPDFRLDYLAYSEVMHIMRRRHPHFPVVSEPGSRAGWLS